MIGIDLGIKNMGLYNAKTKKSLTLSLDDFTDIEEFSSYLAELVNQNNIYVDYSWQLNYWPGNKKTKQQMIFIAGVLWQASQKCIFVEPKQIREMLGFVATVPKREIHRTAVVLYPEIARLNPHEKDAFLLTKWGEKNEVHG